MRIECIYPQGTVLGTIYHSPSSFPTTAKVYEWAVPLTCFGGQTLTVRITRLGSNCLGVDFARLKVTSTQAPPPPPPPPPPNLVFDNHTIEGDSDQVSVAPGETLAFKV